MALVRVRQGCIAAQAIPCLQHAAGCPVCLAAGGVRWSWALRHAATCPGTVCCCCCIRQQPASRQRVQCHHRSVTACKLLKYAAFVQAGVCDLVHEPAAVQIAPTRTSTAGGRSSGTLPGTNVAHACNLPCHLLCHGSKEPSAARRTSRGILHAQHSCPLPDTHRCQCDVLTSVSSSTLAHGSSKHGVRNGASSPLPAGSSSLLR